jgi:hypothetical protein
MVEYFFPLNLIAVWDKLSNFTEYITTICDRLSKKNNVILDFGLFG